MPKEERRTKKQVLLDRSSVMLRATNSDELGSQRTHGTAACDERAAV